jgi:hypothetical protein
MGNKRKIKKRSLQSQSMMRNFIDNSTVGMKVVVVLFIIMCILAVVLAIISNIKNQERGPGIPIANFSEVSDAPEEYQINTEQLIWMLTEQNGDVEDLSQYSAKIRNGSYSEETDKKTRKAHFIVDIEELRYSFEVTMSWLEGRTKKEDLYVKIQCPYYTDVIYAGTKCVAETPEMQIKRYLPHNEYLDNKTLVHVEESSVGREHRLLVKVDACRNQNITDAAIERTVKWIKSIYMNPEDFVIEPYDTCMAR